MDSPRDDMVVFTDEYGASIDSPEDGRIYVTLNFNTIFLNLVIIHGEPNTNGHVWVDTYDKDHTRSTYGHLHPDEAEAFGLALIKAAQVAREK